MKGIKKIILRNADVLNDQQMKSIFGGSGSSSDGSGTKCLASCGTKCPNTSPCNAGKEVYATISCNYTCSALDGSRVVCKNSSGSVVQSMSCEKAYDIQCYCSQKI